MGFFLELCFLNTKESNSGEIIISVDNYLSICPVQQVGLSPQKKSEDNTQVNPVLEEWTVQSQCFIFTTLSTYVRSVEIVLPYLTGEIQHRLDGSHQFY